MPADSSKRAASGCIGTLNLSVVSRKEQRVLGLEYDEIKACTYHNVQHVVDLQ